MVDSNNVKEEKNPVIQIVPYNGIWTRKDVESDLDNLYIFTDNTDRDSGRRVVSKGSEYYQRYGNGDNDLHYPSVTSAVIRGLDNAFPVSTQRWYHNGAKGETGRWNDSDIDEFRKVIDKEFDIIRQQIVKMASKAIGNNSGHANVTVYLPGGNDGFAGGKISAITQERTPRLYAELKDQEETLYYTAALFDTLIVNNAGTKEQLRKIALKAFETDVLIEGYDLGPADVNYYADMSKEELRSIILHYVPKLGKEQRDDILVSLGGEPISMSNIMSQDTPSVKEQQEAVDLSPLASYSPYQLKTILDDVPFPERGASRVYDDAADFINEKLHTGWNRDMSVPQEKAHLLSIVGQLPGIVAETIIDYAKAQMPIRVVDSNKDNQSVFEETPCDVYSLGFSTKTLDEFKVCLPPDTKVIIDTRVKAYNRFRPWFNDTQLSASLRDLGIEYVHIPEDDNDPVAKIQKLIVDNPSKVVICSATSKPSQSIVGLDLGPKLERSGIKVGHITQGFDSEQKRWTSKIHVQTQEELTKKLLGGQEIKNGSYKQISFTSDGKPILQDGVVLHDKVVKVIEDRNIIGKDNYNNPVIISETENDGVGEALFEASKQAHYTLVFTAGHPSMHESMAISSSPGRVSRIHVPDDDEKLRDINYARKIVYGQNGKAGVIDSIGRSLLRQEMQFPDDFKKDNLVLHIEGVNEPRLLNKPQIDGHVTEDELLDTRTRDDFRKIGGFNEGFTLVRPSHASLDSFREFVKNIITVINEPEKKEILGEMTVSEKNYHFSSVISIGDSGAGEAGLIAAQELDMKPLAQAPKGFRFSIDDGTLQGRLVRDEAMFRNRFKLGMRKGYSEDDLRLLIDHVYEAGNNILGPGLTDRQVLVLSGLGYSNSDILLVQQQCLVNNIRITEVPEVTADGRLIQTGSAELLELLEQCSEGYGVAFPGVSDFLSIENIKAVEENVDKMLNNYRRNGVGVITIANKYYPEQFTAFEGFDSERTSQEVIRSETGVSVETVTSKVREERPAILTFRGNIEALAMDKVAITGNTLPEDYERRAASEIGASVAKEGIAVVTAFRPTRVYKHSSPFVIGSELVLGKDTDNIRSRPGKLYEVSSVPTDAPYFAAAAAQDAGGTHIAISPNSLLFKEDQDRINRIIESGGVVLSEAKFESGMGDNVLYERAGHLACVLGGKAIVTGSISNEYSTSPSREAQSSIIGTAVVSYGEIASNDAKIEGSETLIKEGSQVLGRRGGGLSDVLSSVRTHNYLAAAESVIEKQIVSVKEKADEKMEMHVDSYQFSVVRKGTKQIFIVPSNYPDVRQAVRTEYGEDVEFAEDSGLAKRNLRDDIVMVGSESVRAFTGYQGTQLQEEPVYNIPLFYEQGKVYSIVTAPRNTKGLIRSHKSRIQNKTDFEAFRELAIQIEGKFLDAVYGNTPGAHKPIRFENAVYPVISQHSVEIYKGEALWARVFLDSRGALKVENRGILADDLTENSYSKFLFPSDLNSELNRGKGENSSMRYKMIELASRLESALLSIPIEESEMFALASREEREDIENRLGNQFLKLSEDNLDVAASDILHGQAAGLLCENSGTEYDSTKALAAVIGEQNRVRKEIGNLMLADKNKDKQIVDAESKRNAAYNQGYSVSEYEKLDQDIDDLRMEKSNILHGLSDARQRFAELERTKEKIATSEKIYLAEANGDPLGKKLTLYLDGAPVEIIPSLATKKNMEKAESLKTEIVWQRKEQDSLFYENIENIENYSAELQDIGTIYDRLHAQEGQKADKSEIKLESFSNGRYIVVRNGKEAYADEALNIRSDFYDSLKPWKGHFGEANKDGKTNFIAEDGTPIVEVWFDSRSRTFEGAMIIEVDGEFGIVGADGKLFGGRMFDNAHVSQDGWCAVRGGLNDGENAGKFNFINSEGKFISKTWFEDCNDFSEGKTIVRLAGKFKEIDKKGKTLRNNVKVELDPGQTLFNSGKGKGRR